MEPNKNIPSFCFESPWLKPFDLNLDSVEVTTGRNTIHVTWTPEMVQDLQTYHNIDTEAELTRLLTEEINREIVENIRVNPIAQDLMTIQPMGAPQGNLFYFDYQFQNITDPIVYDDGSWSYENSFESTIGIKSEIKQHKII